MGDCEDKLFLALEKLDKIDEAVDRQNSAPLARNRSVRKILRESGLYDMLTEYRNLYKPMKEE